MLDLVRKHKINIFGNSVEKTTGEGYDVDGLVEDKDINTKNDIKNAIRYYNGQFFWDLRNISTRYEQKIELIIKLHRQMICQGNFSMEIDI